MAIRFGQVLSWTANFVAGLFVLGWFMLYAEWVEGGRVDTDTFLYWLAAGCALGSYAVGRALRYIFSGY